MVAHEFGHFIGIKEHTTNPDSLMRGTYDDITNPSNADLALASKMIHDFNRKMWFVDLVNLAK